MWWNRGTTLSRTEDWLERALDLASRASETHSVLEACLDCALREFGAMGAALYLPDEHDPGLLRLAYGTGAYAELPVVCNRHESLMAHVFASHSAGLIRPIPRRPPFCRNWDRRLRPPFWCRCACKPGR